MPPATHYHLGEEGSGFYAEFLTPLTGSERSRSGRRKATAHVGGVNSQQLRFIELLLEHPWIVELRAEEFGLPAPKSLRVANPVAFLAQKLLIHRKRSSEGQAKDILYVHDTLQVFGARLGDLRNEWTSRIRPVLHPKAAKTVETAHTWLFGDVTDAIREAASIPADRRMTSEAVRGACQFGLQQVVG